MAGISSMIVVGWLSVSERARSGIPVDEVTVQAQTCGGAFLGVELGGDDIVARDGAAIGAAVVGFADDVFRPRRLRVIAVHEVEIRAVLDAFPQRVRARLAHAGPARMC